jgi:peptidoglycan/xylan/chitin deacetylase (PgdA/CDA1 family)
MIECIFTIDYEIYGNGEGALRELVSDPTERLIEIFTRYGVPFVAFVEAAEFEIIEAHATDAGIGAVRRQVRDLYERGCEIALHLHPQWYNARYEGGRWHLDHKEYNLCTLAPERIHQILTRSIKYLGDVIGQPGFVPVSFRAGNWLFQPSKTAAQMLAEIGVRIDSSVFKGGRQRNRNLDYRAALANGYYWRFTDDANVATEDGPMLEVPTYSVMVPFWKMLTSKRVNFERKSPTTMQTKRQKMNRMRDLIRPLYPLKFDFCRMTLEELTSIMDRAIDADRRDPASYKPLCAIGHSKDLNDFETIEAFLSYLKQQRIPVVNLQDILPKCVPAERSAVLA